MIRKFQQVGNPFCALLPALTPTELSDEELALEFHKCFTMRKENLPPPPVRPPTFLKPVPKSFHHDLGHINSGAS